MAGIGQRYTTENVPWSSSQHSSAFPESNKPFSPFMPPEKRSFVSGGTGNSPGIGDLPIRNGELSQSRNSSYLLDPSNMDNGPSILSGFVSKRSPFTSESNPLIYNGMSQIKSLSSISRFPPTNGNLLDPSEFPPIQSSGNKQSNSATLSSNPTSLTQSSQSSTQLRNYMLGQSNPAPQFKQGVDISAPSQSVIYSSPEFSNENEFPALPGSQTVLQQANLSRSQPHTPQPNVLYVNGIIGSSQTPLNSSLSQGISTSVPKNMISDQYGLLGLLKLLHVGDLDSTHHLLAPGIDVLSLNINCQTPGELYPTFLSPCHDSCMGRPQDLDYQVPQEYLIRHAITELFDPPMGRLNENTLFWLFYNCCQEEVQLVAAKELSNQKWLFHKKENVWFMPPGIHQQTITYWDPIKAKRCEKEMIINYPSDVDEYPSHCRTSSGLLSANITNISTNINQSSSSGANLTTPSVTSYMLQQSNLLNAATSSGLKPTQYKSQNSTGIFSSGGSNQPPAAVSIANRTAGLVPNGAIMHVSASSSSLIHQAVSQKQMQLSHHLVGSSSSNGGTNGQPNLPNGLTDPLASMFQDKLLFKTESSGKIVGTPSTTMS